MKRHAVIALLILGLITFSHAQELASAASFLEQTDAEGMPAFVRLPGEQVEDLEGFLSRGSPWTQDDLDPGRFYPVAVAAYAPELGMKKELAVRIGTGMAGGVGLSGNVCGAVVKLDGVETEVYGKKLILACGGVGRF